MNHKFDKTVLMVFSLSVAGEYQRKPHSGFRKTAASVAVINQCIKHTQAIANDSEIELLWFSEEQQRGKTFAERYKNAIKFCFDAGYERVVSIGNDSPDLTADIIREAAEKLLTHNIVAGPAEDGGVYLLGLNKATFDENLFVNLPWQQDSLYTAILETAETQNLSVVSLASLIDLDDVQSVNTYISRNPSSKIGWLLSQFNKIVRQKVALPFQVVVLPKVHIATNPFRGPPAIFT
ncbi:MAG: DUF2064 domain-containing protein [Spirosomaceae bacterium]|nr:DUF2064 domain-containing protein [Spirosomataceae bacterium]